MSRTDGDPRHAIEWHSPTTDDLLAGAELDKLALEAKLAARDAEIKTLRENMESMADDIHKLVIEIQNNCPKDQIVKRWVGECDYRAQISLKG